MAVVTAMVFEAMSCRCIHEQWQRDRAKQRDLAKKTALLKGKAQVLYKTPEGFFRFVTEGEAYNGIFEEIITQY